LSAAVKPVSYRAEVVDAFLGWQTPFACGESRDDNYQTHQQMRTLNMDMLVDHNFQRVP